MQPVTDVPRTDPYPWEQRDMDEASAITGGSTSSAYDDGRGPDPEAWVFEPQWEDQRGVYSNWQNWTSWDVKGEDTENLEEEAVEGAGGGQDGDEEEEDDEEVDQEDDGVEWKREWDQ